MSSRHRPREPTKTARRPPQRGEGGPGRPGAQADPAAKARGAAAGPPRLDATNLAGLTTLMNPQHLRAGADLESAEQAVMGKAGPPPKKASEADPVQLYTQELNDLAEELGIDFLDDGGGEGDAPPAPPAEAAAGAAAAGTAAPAKSPGAPRADPSSSRPRNPLRGKTIDDLLGDLDLSSSSSVGAKGRKSGSNGGSSSSSASDASSSSGPDGASSSSSSSSSSGGSESGEDGDEDEESGDDDSVVSNLGKELGINLARTRRRGRSRNRVHGFPCAGRGDSGGRARLSNLTEEQERRRHINSVMGDMRHETRTSFGVEHERAQDVKASKLEQIGQLRMTLEEEGIDCSGVGDPTMASAVEEIDSVLNILKLKNDRNRYSSLAEEVILGVAEGVETVLDGTREVPVLGWKPDYSGYHNTVNIKLHRMRFETSQVVGNVIEKYNVGPSARIVMELLPSFFLYPRQQRKQRGTPGLHADPAAGGPRVGDARQAFSAIRRSDNPDIADTVSAI